MQPCVCWAGEHSSKLSFQFLVISLEGQHLHRGRHERSSGGA